MIYDKFKLAGKVGARLRGEIGLEIETESKKAYEPPLFSYWTTHPDGSLRDFGIEYVLKQPLMYEKELDLALEEWKTKTSGLKFITDSVTTSVHVHLNFLNRTFVELGNFLTTYALIENILIRYSGDDRRSNLFCLPICDAEETYHNIRHMFQNFYNKNYGYRETPNQVKYAACNIATLSQYGSIELRSFRGETNINLIRDWIDILYDIYTYAQTKDLDPKKILSEWREKETLLLDVIFSKKSLKNLSTIKGIKELIEPNVWYAASIAYSVKGDWRELDADLKIPEFKPKTADLNQCAVMNFGQDFDRISEEQKEWVIDHLKRTFEKDYLSRLTNKNLIKSTRVVLETAQNAQRAA